MHTGTSSSTVEQIGTDSDCAKGVPTYFAWWEFYPAKVYAISSLTLTPGDVRSLGTVAAFALIFGVATGAAIGLTCSHHVVTSASANPNAYEEEVTKTGLVVINKTNEGTTYQLTELGRRFLKEYRFLEKNTEARA